MNIVILGGTGFISSNITEKCLLKGNEVIHFNRGHRRTLYDIVSRKGDRHNEEDLNKSLKYKPDVIIDMICFNKEDAELSVKVFANNIEHYIYCSTSCVYTPRISNNYILETSETNPISKYGSEKLKAENIFLKAMSQGVFKTTIFRPGHIFGQNFLVNNLSLEGRYVLKRFLLNEPVILTERGKRYFQACHVDNVGDIFSEVCKLKKAYGNIYNIAGEELFTWNDIYKIERKLLNSKSDIIYKNTDYIVSLAPKYFDFLNTYTKFDWMQSMDNLHKDVKRYSYKVNFITGMRRFIEENEKEINRCDSEKNIYEKILNI